MSLGDLVFQLEPSRHDATRDLDENRFQLGKRKQLIDEFREFFCARPSFDVRNLLELGTWEGGSVAFWQECFRPLKHVSVDISSGPNSEHLEQYLRSRTLRDRVKTYWGVNQGDVERLRSIVKAEFSEPLDLVIDDASHTYELTKSSFEALFSFLRPGGLYIIEDWSWAHWIDFMETGQSAREIEPTGLIYELVKTTGTTDRLIHNLTIFHDFVSAERSSADFPDKISLTNYIQERKILPLQREITEMKKQINQLENSYAIRLARSIPFGAQIRKLLASKKSDETS
jgi:hypothetical protein